MYTKSRLINLNHMNDESESQSGLRFQIGLSSFRVSCKRAQALKFEQIWQSYL